MGFVTVLTLSHGVFYIPKLSAFNEKSIQNLEHIEKKEVLDLELYGVGVKNSKDNAKIINAIIQKFKGRELILKLPSGEIDIYEPIIIDKDNITLKGEGRDKTVIISHLKKPNLSAIQIRGERKSKIGYLREDIVKGDSIFKINFDKDNLTTSFLLLREPNSKKFIDKLGAKKWNKKYPYLRQQIVKVVHNDLKESLVYTKKPILLDLSGGITEVYALKIVKNVHLKEFQIRQVVLDEDIEKYSFVYKNLFKDFQVDAIRFDYVASSQIENVKILNAGRHSLVFENSYNLLADNLIIDKSWNKGKGGSGYLRVARSYHSEVRNSSIYNIRHLTLHWSSAGNHLHHLNMGVDINLHGGFSHDNKIDNIRFNIPKKHLWSEIEHTPNDAKWAPPDGENEIDMKTIIRK